MFFIDHMPETEVWDVGDQVGISRKKHALARADLSLASVCATGLTVQLTATPHPRHADVGGWPSEKAQQKSIALDLCVASRFRLRPAES